MLYGAVEHWLSGALVNVGDMIWYDMISAKFVENLYLSSSNAGLGLSCSGKNSFRNPLSAS